MIKDYLDEKLHEECGVFGVYRRDADLDVVGTTYYGLYALQHRGQESCGMAVNDDGVFYKRRELGLVNDVFTKDVLETMPRGNMCIGHCRYATTGVPVRSNAQPFVIRHIKGPMALAHNGNLTNSAELRSEFELSGAIFHSTSDTEVIAYAITRERLSSDSIEQAVEQTMDRLKGAYSLVVMSPRKLIAARDPQGFRPLCIGKLGENDIIASESCAITAAGGEFVRDVEPGEIVVFDENGCRSIRTAAAPQACACLNTCTSPGRILLWTALPYTGRAGEPARFWRWSTLCRRTSSSACRIRAWTRRWAIPSRAASLTASAF